MAAPPGRNAAISDTTRSGRACRSKVTSSRGRIRLLLLIAGRLSSRPFPGARRLGGPRLTLPDHVAPGPTLAEVGPGATVHVVLPTGSVQAVLAAAPAEAVV